MDNTNFEGSVSVFRYSNEETVGDAQLVYSKKVIFERNRITSTDANPTDQFIFVGNELDARTEDRIKFTDDDAPNGLNTYLIVLGYAAGGVASSSTNVFYFFEASVGGTAYIKEVEMKDMVV
jgi:hypothetical protein